MFMFKTSSITPKKYLSENVLNRYHNTGFEDRKKLDKNINLKFSLKKLKLLVNDG